MTVEKFNPEQFIDFQNKILPTEDGRNSPPSALQLTDLISVQFQRKLQLVLINLYNEHYPSYRESNRVKYQRMKECIHAIQGTPKKNQNGEMLIGTYKKGQVRYRENNEEERQRWHCDQVPFLKYKMIWKITFLACTTFAPREFTETVYTSKEGKLTPRNRVLCYLDALVQACVISKKASHSFPPTGNWWRVEYGKNVSACIDENAERIIPLTVRTIFFKEKDVQGFCVAMEESVQLPIKTAIEDESEQDLFLDIAEQLDKCNPNKDFIRNGEKILDKVYQRSVPSCWKLKPSTHKMEVWTEKAFKAYLDWSAAKYQELHAQLPKLAERQKAILSPLNENEDSCFVLFDLSEFEEIAMQLLEKEPNRNAIDTAREMANCYQEMFEIWTQLRGIQTKILSISRRYLNYTSPPIADADGNGNKLNMSQSLSEWEAAIDWWNCEAQRCTGNRMHDFCRRYVEKLRRPEEA